MSYEHFKYTLENKVAHVVINRPDKANALNEKAWEELKVIFEQVDKEPEARVAILSGEGKLFCAGMRRSVVL